MSEVLAGKNQFVIWATDGQPGTELRSQIYSDHVDHVASARDYGVEVVLAGPVKDGETIIGSLFVLEAPSRAAAEKFHDADPFKESGVYCDSIVAEFDRKR